MSYITVNCNVTDLGQDLQRAVQGYLGADEQITACFYSKYDDDFSRRLLGVGIGPIRAAAVITQRQLISVHQEPKRFGVSRESAVLLTDIVGVQEGGSDGSQISAHGHGGVMVFCNFASRREAQVFATLLRDSVAQAGIDERPMSFTTEAGVTDDEERLRRLIRLHNDGLISDEEFQHKRNAILGRL